MLRLFWAIELPQDLRKKLGKVREKIKFKSAKWVEQENIHLTLKFLGSTPEEKVEEIRSEVEKICRNHQPFQISLSTFGAFPSNKKARVLWFGVAQGADKAICLAKDIEKAMAKLGFEEERKPYHPHITLARLKFLEQIDEERLKLLAQNFEGSQVEVKEITLFQSQLTPKGPIYTPLSRIALKQGLG